jgi:hypothetical protein
MWRSSLKLIADHVRARLSLSLPPARASEDPRHRWARRSVGVLLSFAYLCAMWWSMVAPFHLRSPHFYHRGVLLTEHYKASEAKATLTSLPC